MLLLHVVDWLADVIANVADVTATSVLADDIAMVVDVKHLTSAKTPITLCGFNIYHHGNVISQHTCGSNISHIGNNISQSINYM